MYGYRKREDLAVTRLYTTTELYEVMSNINDFDSKLREDFEQGNFENGVIFISKDEKGNTKSKSYIRPNINKIDNILKRNNNGKIEGSFKISVDDISEIIELIYDTLEIETSTCVDKDTFLSLIKYLTKEEINVFCAVNRNMSRLRKTSRYYSDMPYNRDKDLKTAKEMAKEIPTIMLMKQNGKKEKGWKDGDFYWPILVVQNNINTAVYTSELLS